MPTTSSIEKQQNSSTTPHALTEQTLSEQEIERICKAFIRLIAAKETMHNGKTNTIKRKPHVSEKTRR